MSSSLVDGAEVVACEVRWSKLIQVDPSSSATHRTAQRPSQWCSVLPDVEIKWNQHIATSGYHTHVLDSPTKHRSWSCCLASFCWRSQSSEPLEVFSELYRLPDPPGRNIPKQNQRISEPQNTQQMLPCRYRASLIWLTVTLTHPFFFMILIDVSLGTAAVKARAPWGQSLYRDVKGAKAG